MRNITANNVGLSITGFITLTEQAKVFVTESAFTNIYSLFEGSVISGQSSKTQTVIHNSVFINNTAQKGGVFYMAYESMLE